MTLAPANSSGGGLSGAGLALDATLTGGNQQVQGNVASGVADAGNPQKIGGRYSAAKETLADGQRGDVQLTSRGAVAVTLFANDSASVPFIGAAADASSNATQSLATLAELQLFNGVTWDRLRGPAVFKTIVASAAGDTALWVPTTGKKFRVMRYAIYLTANAAAAAAGILEILLRDAANPIGVGFSAFVPAAAGATFGADAGSGWCDIGNGFLSALANNTLNVNLSFALTAGEVRVVVCGTEE